PGDLDSLGLDALFAELPIDCDIILAPHHGSCHSDPPGFARWCSPEWVVISSGVYSDAEEAECAYRQAGAVVLNTAKVGMVRFSIDASEVRVAKWLEHP
ncbi:MAG: hypothetical protein JW829_15780, partial [Pirellulales bacterium]|nr:hypothetical protein [Pirellulales bacterium]